MAKIININPGGKFDTVSIDTTENVCFANLDSVAHWPDIASNQVGAFKSANSSDCVVTPDAGKTQVTYGCKLHTGEKGVINVVQPLAAGKDAKGGKLAAATKGTSIGEKQVVQGGTPPYKVNRQVFQVTDGTGKVTPGMAGLKLNNPPLTPGAPGITVSGTPTMSGTYTFALDVDDSQGRNLQQMYTMVVT
jgi:hypothetical protein